MDENKVCEAIEIAKGDLFMAAGFLGVSAHKLDCYIRSKKELQEFCYALVEVKNTPEYEQMSSEQFANQLSNLTKAYKVEAIEIIHEIATMPINDSAAMAEVKLKAAIQLRGNPSDTMSGGESTAVLQELNQLYQQSAPRIKTIRIAQIQYED